MSNEFSWSAAREARLDRAIDRAVREMMQVEPAPGLRRRVLSRITESSASRRHLRLPGYAFAAVAVVLFVLSITRLQERLEPPTPPKAPAIAASGIPPVQPLSVGIDPDATAPPPNAPRPHITQEPIRMPRVTNVFGNQPREVSAATIDVGRRDIVVPPLAIVPLSTRPIVLEPLVFPAPRKGGQ